jgi:periplasmic protein TonB
MRMTAPARPRRLPVGGAAVSLVIHAVGLGVLIAGTALWQTERTKPYIVNLVPAVAAVGVPHGKPDAPPAPPRPAAPPAPPAPRAVETPAPPAPPAPRSAPAELPRRQPVREAPAPEMPSRQAPRDLPRLPEPDMPARVPTPPRLAAKDLPSVTTPAPRSLPTPAPSAPPASAPPAPAPVAPSAPAAPPPPPLGRPTGSPQGVGAVTLDVSDFPYAYYLRTVHRKISEKWEGRARDGQQPVAVFEIGRDGQLMRLSIEKSSGNTVYDQAALRAITDASPFPPLPPDFKESLLRIHLGFNYAGAQG